MPEREYFTEEEAAALVGVEVEALHPFPSVPLGTRGKVTRASRYAGERYVVEVHWELPRPNQMVDITIPEFSFNLLRKRKAVTDEFCRTEFEELLRVAQHAERP